MATRDAVAGEAAPALSVAAVARRLGVAPATLRTWDRRYGLGPSEHEAGSHRRYTAADVARLVVMRRLTLEGVAPAAAAAAAAATAESHLPSVAELPPSAGSGVVAADPQGPDDAAGRPVAAASRDTEPAQELEKAALAGDEAACEALIGAAARRRGPVWAWQELVLPSLEAVGRRWELNAPGADAETVLRAGTLAALRHLAPVPLRTSGVVLVASPGHEAATSVLHVIAAAVRADGVRAWVLAAGLPREAVATAVRRTGPLALVLHAERLVPDARSLLASLPRLRTPARLVLAGPGWSLTHVPEGRVALHAPDLEATLELVAEATAP